MKIKFKEFKLNLCKKTKNSTKYYSDKLDFKSYCRIFIKENQHIRIYASKKQNKLKSRNMSYLKLVAIVFFLVKTLNTSAQVELIFGDSLVNEKAIATYPMADGSFWVVGFSNVGIHGGADVALTRLDSLGNTISPVVYFGGADNDYPNNMIYKSGKLIIAGETHTGINNNVDGFILVVDTAGVLESFNVYGQVGQTEQFFDIKATQDGGFVVSGFASLPNRVGNDFLIAKFDERNNYKWMQIHDLGSNDIGMVALEKPQGGYILVGDQLQPSGNYNVALIGCDTLGNMLWDTTVVNPYNGGCKQATIQDNQLVIVGEMGTASSTAFDLYLIRTDLQGNLIWQGTIPKTDNGDAAFDLIVKSLNQIFITGYVYNNVTQGTDLVVMEIDSIGGILNERYYGGTSFDMGIDIQVLDDERFIIAGFTNRQASDQYYIIYDSFSPINAVSLLQNKNDLAPVYPNPTKDVLNLPQDINFSQVELIDDLGRSFLIKVKNQQIDIRHFNTGKYWVVLKDDEGNVVDSQSVIKE